MPKKIMKNQKGMIGVSVSFYQIKIFLHNNQSKIVYTYGITQNKKVNWVKSLYNISIFTKPAL